MKAWMPLYINDYIADTTHLSLAEHGCYMKMILHYWRLGKLPNNNDQIAKIIGVRSAREKALIENIKSQFFSIQEIHISHKRLDKELSKAIELSEKRSAIAKQMHSKSSANDMQLHTQSQSQSQSHKEKTKKKKKEPSPSAPFQEAFEGFWFQYPNRIGKPAALTSWNKHIKTHADLDQFKQALDNYLKHLEATRSDFVLHGSTFFNGDSHRANYKGWRGWIEKPLIQAPARRNGKQTTEELLRTTHEALEGME